MSLSSLAGSLKSTGLTDQAVLLHCFAKNFSDRSACIEYSAFCMRILVTYLNTYLITYLPTCLITYLLTYLLPYLPNYLLTYSMVQSPS